MDRRPSETSQDDDLDDVRLNPNITHIEKEKKKNSNWKII